MTLWFSSIIGPIECARSLNVLAWKNTAILTALFPIRRIYNCTGWHNTIKKYIFFERNLIYFNIQFPFPLLFPPVSHKNVLAEWLSSQGVTQFHCAGLFFNDNKIIFNYFSETEKYAHVTFFFNGGREVQFDGEERSMVPSPKVATYDLQPEMNAAGVAEKV